MPTVGYDALDTPQTKIGDATCVSIASAELDISEEQSFRVPLRNANALGYYPSNERCDQQNSKTPLVRQALSNQRNLPGFSEGEFTPMLKIATRNSCLKHAQKYQASTPVHDSHLDMNSIYENSSQPVNDNPFDCYSKNDTYMTSTPASNFYPCSTVSTPTLTQVQKINGSEILENGPQLSLREQQSIAEKIEKENFGLKLKIHFLETALQKTGDEYTEATIRENAELKVDKITMMKEFSQLRKTLDAAERDVELYRKNFDELQKKIKQKHASGNQRELEDLRRYLKEKLEELDQLKKRDTDVNFLENRIQKLEYDLQEKNCFMDKQAYLIDQIKQEAEEREVNLREMEITAKEAQDLYSSLKLEGKAQSSKEIENLQKYIQLMEEDMRKFKLESENAKKQRQDTLKEKEQVEAKLQELQEEMANKSLNSKGLNHQIEEKASRTQKEFENLQKKHSSLDSQNTDNILMIKNLEATIHNLKVENHTWEQKLNEMVESAAKEHDISIREQKSAFAKYESCQKDFNQLLDEKKTLQIRCDDLKNENTSLQHDLEQSQKSLSETQGKLMHENEIKNEYQGKINQLVNKLEDFKARYEEKEREIKREFESWTEEKRNLLSQKNNLEEKVAGLQRTIDRLEKVEGTLSTTEAKLKQTLNIESQRHSEQEESLNRQISDLRKDNYSRQQAYAEIQTELETLREELRLSKREQEQLVEKVEFLEDEVTVLQSNLDEETESHKIEIDKAKEEADKLRQELISISSDPGKPGSVALDEQAKIEGYPTNTQKRAGDSTDQLHSRLKDAEEQLSNSQQERISLQDKLNRANTEVLSLKASKTQLETENLEIKTHNEALLDQKEPPNCDPEEIQLRSLKLKLDREMRRLQKENKIIISEKESIEKELECETARANDEQIRLTKEIHDLQTKLRGLPEKRELATTKSKVYYLEERIKELEKQMHENECSDENQVEISSIYRDLKEAQNKELEYMQRESTLKEKIRDHKRRIDDLECQLHNFETSRSQKGTPQLFNEREVMNKEINELRSQVLSLHKELKELRIKLKETTKGSRKVTASQSDVQARKESFEAEKTDLKCAFDRVQLAKQELEGKNFTAEATIARLRSKIDYLEKSLQAERLSTGENRNSIREHENLHEMLRKSQSQIKSLENLTSEYRHTMMNHHVTENDLRNQLMTVQEERTRINSNLISCSEKLEKLKRKFHTAKESWDAERKNLTPGVRFSNMPLSKNEESLQIMSLRPRAAERERQLIKENRGLNLQLEWFKAKCSREEFFRAEAAYAKRYMALQIDLFKACNSYDLNLLEDCGIKRPEIPPKKRITIYMILNVIRAISRMKICAEKWAKTQLIDQKLKVQLEKQRMAISKEQAMKNSKSLVTQGRKKSGL